MKRFALIVFFFALFPVLLCAYDIRLLCMGTRIENGFFYAQTASKDPLPEELVDYVKNGVQISISRHIEIKRERFAWFDDTIESRRITAVVSYDPWTRRYVVNDSYLGTYTTRTAEDAFSRIESEMGIRMMETNALLPENNYYLMTRLVVQYVDVYPGFNVFFNILATLKYRIKWAKSELWKGSTLLSNPTLRSKTLEE